MSQPTGRVHQVVEHLFRREVGRIVSRLARVFGLHQLALIEDSVQFSMMQALLLWPYQGVPDNPRAWLLRVSANHALDRIKVERRHVPIDDDEQGDIRADVSSLAQAPSDPVRFADELSNDELALIFACCHPLLPPSASVVLTLKVVCGLGVEEIARAFLSAAPTIAQRLVRAKRTIRDKRLLFEVPGPAELPGRLDSVLQVLYLLFTEGYAPTAGDRVVKKDLCADAIRLAGSLVTNSITARPECHALLALMLFQAARFESRTDAAGELLLLEEQDRTRWDQSMIAHGLRQLEQAGHGARLTSYHVQAEIAAVHVCAGTFEQTDWAHILALYDLLLEIEPTAVVRVNRAVALAQVDGPQAGLAALRGIDAPESGDPTPAVWMAAGEFNRRCGDIDAAIAQFSRALAIVRTEPERRFVERKLELLRAAALE